MPKVAAYAQGGSKQVCFDHPSIRAYMLQYFMLLYEEMEIPFPLFKTVSMSVYMDFILSLSLLSSDPGAA